MKLATTTGDFAAYTTDNIKAIEYIAEAGFKYIDYSFCIDHRNRTGVFGDDENYLDKLMQRIKNLDVELVQSHAPFESFSLEKEQTMLVNDITKCVRVCSKLGIRTIVVHTGYGHNFSQEETFEKNKQFFAPILRVAEDCGIYVLAENFNKMCANGVYWIDNASDLYEFINYVNHPMLKAVWDTGHANLQDMTQHSELKILGKYVMGLHVHDNYGDDDKHTAPFLGTLNIDSLMTGLIDIDYKGYFTFEAGNIFSSMNNRRHFDGENRLLKAPLDLRIKAEKLLYEIGKTILDAYNCFEE